MLRTASGVSGEAWIVSLGQDYLEPHRAFNGSSSGPVSICDGRGPVAPGVYLRYHQRQGLPRGTEARVAWPGLRHETSCGDLRQFCFRALAVLGLIMKYTRVFLLVCLLTAVSFGQAVPASFFGLHFHQPNDIPTVTFGACRIWMVSFFPLTRQTKGALWPQIEAQPGVFDFSVLDAELAAAKQSGIDDGCVFTFGPTPQWASLHPSDRTCDHATQYSGGCWPPTDLNYDGTGTDKIVIDAITAIAQHVNDPTYLTTHAHIRYWEPWNEPYRSVSISGTDCRRHACSFNGSYAELVRIAEDFRTVVKGIDATALIVTPSGNAHFNVNGRLVVANFLDCAHKPRSGSNCITGTRGSNAVDVINTHCYVGTQNADDVIGYLQAMRALLDPVDKAKPFLCDEGGWGSNLKTTDPDIQAGFVARWYMDIWSQNVILAGWYAWDDFTYGILWYPKGSNGCQLNVGCLTKAGTAYTQTYSWLVGATLGGCTAQGSVATCSLSRPNGYQAEMVWVNTTLTTCTGQTSSETCGSMPYTVPAQYTTKRDLDGVRQPAKRLEIIGAKPLLFENQ